MPAPITSPATRWKSAGHTTMACRPSRALYDLEVPIIAAENGPAMGAGMDFATMCTIRIASEKAKFAESFIKLGLTSAAGGAWFPNRAIGTSAAAEMTLTGDTIDQIGRAHV